jgi:hypothetical protein
MSEIYEKNDRLDIFLSDQSCQDEDYLTTESPHNWLLAVPIGGLLSASELMATSREHFQPPSEAALMRALLFALCSS